MHKDEGETFLKKKKNRKYQKQTVLWYVTVLFIVKILLYVSKCTGISRAGVKGCVYVTLGLLGGWEG